MTQTVEPEAPAPSEDRAREDWRPGLRALLLRLHSYAGILVGPFLLIAACTGLLYVFTPQIDELVYAHELTVPAAATDVPLSTQVNAAQAALPGAQLSEVRPAPDPEQTTRVIFAAPDLPEDYNRTVFVNPHDGSVRGTLETFRNEQELPVQAWFDGLHKNLHLGDAGRFYSELAASWLWVLVTVGIALWLRKRIVARRTGQTKRKLAGRRRLLSWHSWVGIGISVVLFFLSATGMTWSTLAGEHISKLRSELSWTAPQISTTLPHSASAQGGGDIGLDRVREVANSAGLEAPLRITPPSEPGSAYQVTRRLIAWPATEDSITVNPANGQIVNRLPSSENPFMGKVADVAVQFHEGKLFGVVNQVLLALTAIGLIIVIVLGYRMWWTRGGPANRGFGALPARGVWRQIPGRVFAPIVLAAVLAGYFAPVLGASLLAFLLIDGLFGMRARRKAALG